MIFLLCELLLLSTVLQLSLALSSSCRRQSPPPVHHTNSRFVCLLNDYSTIRSPYFKALFDQLLTEQCAIYDRRVAICTSDVNIDTISKTLVPKIQQDLLLDDKSDMCKVFNLKNYNPISIQETMEDFQPTIFWVVDDNTFRIRYQMRTSGLDGILYRLCGKPASSSSFDGSNKNCLYIGENAGAICAGPSLEIGHIVKHDPKQAPEPQHFGLSLLGPKRSIAFGLSKEDVQTSNADKIDISSVTILETNQIFVWSQPHDDKTTSFVFSPSKRGMIENWDSPSPVPPLMENGDDDTMRSKGGVQCDGEPSVDPSRMMQQVGDSEWVNEAEDTA